MGMFDHLTILDGVVADLHCAGGHAVDELQTKDLYDPSLDSYYIIRDRLFRGERSRAKPQVVFGEDRLLLRTDIAAAVVSHTGAVRAYNHCDECAPVLSLGEVAWDGDLVREHSPWCEWELRFVEGKLVDACPIRCESRDDLRRGLEARGVEVLADDDRLARRHRARAERDRREGLALL